MLHPSAICAEGWEPRTSISRLESGHDFSRAERWLKENLGFSPGGAERNPLLPNPAEPILNPLWQKAETAETRMDYSQIITIEPGKRSGKACIRGLRITVYDVLDYMAAGMSQDEILADFPDLTEADIRACLAFAADTERRFEIVSL